MRRISIILAGLALVAAACGDDGADTTTTTDEPATGPSEIVFEDQVSDGTTIVVASVTMPSPGFIGVHGNADGAPGPVIGHSALLPAGTSTNVVIVLDEPLTETDLVWPMVHIDMDGNGVYEFFPPDVTIDLPGVTAEGNIAVVSGEVTVEG